MHDRFMIGLIAGSISGIFSSLVDLILVKILKFGDLTYIDFAGIVFLGDKVKSIPEGIHCQLIQAFYSGFLGVIFVHLISIISGRYYRIKGAIFGLGVWFFTHAVVHLYQLPHMSKMRLDSSVENEIIAIFYGYLLAEMVYWLTKGHIVRDNL